MKSGCVIKKLGEVCELINGKNQSEVANPSGKYPIYGSGGVMGRADDFRCPAGCTIIGRKGSINNPLYVTEPFWNVDTAYALSPTGVESKFLYYFCLSFDFSKLDCGTTIPSLTSAIVKDVDMPIPPLPEQKRIVAKIDAAFEKIDKLKANAERNLANAKELFQSALDEAMRPKKGWVEKRLGEVGKATTGITPSTRNKDNFGEYIPFVKPGDISPFEPIAFRKDGLSQRGVEEGRLIRRGSTLMVCIGASIGKTGYANIDCTCNQQINALTPGDKIDGRFLYYLLSSEKFKNKVIAEAGQATLPIISKSKWECLAISMPIVVAEQRQIVKRLDILAEKTELLEQHYARQIADCAEMRQSVLREAFEGRL